jgi:hypothetical protein
MLRLATIHSRMPETLKASKGSDCHKPLELDFEQVAEVRAAVEGIKVQFVDKAIHGCHAAFFTTVFSLYGTTAATQVP